MRPDAIAEVGLLFMVGNMREMVIASYAEPCVATLHARVPLPDWPNAAANEAHYFGPTES